MNKTIRLVEKFKNDPKSPGLNYEKLGHGVDSRLHSLRVDGAYRVILFKPDKGDVYILLWVDHHDEAYDWARRHRCQIHPETGSLQVLQTEYTEAAKRAAPKKKDAFFARFRQRELLRLGVPPELIEEVRTIDTEEELDAMRERLPEEAYEGLFYLLAGDSYEEVLRYLDLEKEERVDTEDFAKALENANSRRRFYVVDENEMDLIGMLNAPLEKWRVFLHPSQRALVYRDWNGPVRVLGGAGTGKTVVAMHRARWLASRLADGGKIFFTTFTKNLATDIYENLRMICSEEELARIEVKNLDQWVYDFLRRQGYKEKIAYADETADLWEEAYTLASDTLDFPLGFYKEEWAHVVQPQSITTLQEYLRASRIGRGTRLGRAQKKAVWEVFEEYRRLLLDRGLKEPADAMRDARILIEDGRLDTTYDAIVVDEAQDFGEQAFMLLRSLVKEGKNDLFIVGDAHQRIYGHKVVLGRCGIKIVGRSRKLKLNYRTTDEIRKWAVRIFEGKNVDDLDDGIDSQTDYKSLYHGPAPEVLRFENYDEELAAIIRRIDELLKEDENATICLVARTRALRDRYVDDLKELGVSVKVLERNSSDNPREKGVRVATMHRVKGLDFDHMIIASANKGVIPLEHAFQGSDDAEIEEAMMKERALLYVAATRAKKTITVTTSAKAPSPFL
jgi:hypothetical protein